jgi:hypothetical protein
MPIKRDEIQWDPIDVSQVQWEGGDSGKFRFASPETEKAGLGLIEQATEAAVKYLGEPADVAAAKYAPTAYASRVLGNMPQDVMNISQGFTPEAMGALGSAMYNQPLQTTADIGSAALQGVGGFLADPLGTFERAPISTAMGLQAAQLARMPGRAAANMAAEAIYPKVRSGLAPQNRMLMDVFGKPEIQAALQEAPPGMTVPQALADINAPRAQAVARQAMALTPDETLAAQQAQGQARMEALSRIARTPQELAAAEEARSAAAKTGYEKAFRSEQPPISPELLNRPSMQVAVREAKNIAAETGETATPMSALHNVKLALDKIVSKPEDYGLGGAQKAAIAKTRQQFIDELSMNLDYARARADFAAQSVPINKMQVAQEILKSATEPLTEGATRAGVFARAVEEAPKTIKKATGQQFFTKLEDVLSPEEMEVVNSVRDEFRRTKLADEQAKLGAKASPEVEELASARVAPAMNIPFLNRTWTIANTLIKRSLGRIDEKLATEIGMMMQDPAELNRAIAAARKYERETKQGVEKLKARRQRVTQVTPKKVISGAVSVQNTMSPENRNAMAR